MKKAEKEQLVKDWLKFARENLLFAKAGLTEDFSPFHTICFLCQGSAEKYLKAFLIWNGWELIKIHDLSKLVNICLDYDDSFETLFEAAELLNEYITEGRYPGDLAFENIDKENAREAIGAAEQIEKFVIEKLKSSIIFPQ